MPSYQSYAGACAFLRLGVMTLASGLAVLPSVSLASTYASATSEAFFSNSVRVTDTLTQSGGPGQATQANTVSSTSETYQQARATADAYAEIGTLKASVSATADSTGNVSAVSRGQSYATARWTDTPTFNALGLFGSAGYLTAQMNVSGFFSGSFSGSFTGPGPVDTAEHSELVRILGTGMSAPLFTSPCGGYSFCAYEIFRSWGPPTISSNIPAVISLMIPIIFGIPTILDYVLDVTDLAFAISDPGTGASGASAQALIDYGHSLTWGGITGVYDQNGKPILDFTTSSDSGFDYLNGLNAASVPAPASYGLVIAGLVLVTVTSRRRKQRQ